MCQASFQKLLGPNFRLLLIILVIIKLVITDLIHIYLVYESREEVKNIFHKVKKKQEVRKKVSCLLVKDVGGTSMYGVIGCS